MKSNWIARYPLYLLGIAIMLSALFGLHGYLADNNSWSTVHQAIYGTLAYPFFAFGASLIIMPALLGRAEFVRFFFGGEIWLLFRTLSYGFYMYVPLYALGYFLSMSNAQHLDYQMMFYNFCGIFIFSLIFGQIFILLFDRPFQSILYYHQDVKILESQASLHPEAAFNIENYKEKLVDEVRQEVGYSYENSPVGNKENVASRNINTSNSRQAEGTTMFDFSNSASPGQIRQTSPQHKNVI